MFPFVGTQFVAFGGWVIKGGVGFLFDSELVFFWNCGNGSFFYDDAELYVYDQRCEDGSSQNARTTQQQELITIVKDGWIISGLDNWHRQLTLTINVGD